MRAKYGSGGCLPGDISVAEARPRAPIYFLKDVRTPTWVIESAQGGNAGAFPRFLKAKGNAPITFALIPNATHFSTLAPTTEALASQIQADTGRIPSFSLDVAALAAKITPAEANE